MTTENNAVPGVAADTATPEEIANTTPEVAAPESNEAEQQPQEKPAQDDSDKSLKRLQRRVDRVTAARYTAEAEARQLRDRLAQYEQQRTPPEEGQQIRPEDIDRIATERAKQMRDMESVHKRSTEIRDLLVKEVGHEEFPRLLSTVIEEAGDLAHPDGRWTPLGEAIADSDSPAKLLTFLGKNPDVAESLRGLTATQLGRRIARIEADMKTPEPKPSKAPKPLDPIKGAADVRKDPSEMSQAEFSAWRRSQIAKRR